MSNNDIPTPEERAATDKECLAKRVPGEEIVALTFAELDYLEFDYRRRCEENGEAFDQGEFDDWITKLEVTPDIARKAVEWERRQLYNQKVAFEGKPGEGLFIVINDVRIARRGDPGTPEAKTWVSLIPGWKVTDREGGLDIHQPLPELVS